MTDRDVSVLTFICRHGIVTVDQIATACFPSKSAAYKRLKALAQLHLVRQDRSGWQRSPNVYRVLEAGARVADCGVGPARLHMAQVPHDVTVVDLALYLLDKYKRSHITTEREFRGDLRRRGEKAHRIPDLVVRVKDEDIAVELDLTFKTTALVQSVIAAHARQADRFAKVWWFVDSPVAAKRYQDVVKGRQADDFITIFNWSA